MNSWSIAQRVKPVIIGLVVFVLLAGCNDQAVVEAIRLTALHNEELRAMLQPTSTIRPNSTPRPTSTLTRPAAAPAQTSGQAQSAAQAATSSGSGTFSLQTANPQRPADILEIVDFFVGGGGPSCFNETEPRLTYGGEYYELVPHSATRTTSEEILFYTCGWNTLGVLYVTVVLPDGRSISDSVETFDDISSGVPYQVDLGLDPPVGTYRFMMGNHEEGITTEFRLERPLSPMMFRLEDGSVVLWNFVPGESVKLIAYEEVEPEPFQRRGKFVAYQEYRVGSDGSLYVEVKGLDVAFAAIGEFTGEVAESHTFSQIDTSSR